MRVCFVCNEYPPGPHGGIGTSVMLAAHALTEAGHDVRVIGSYRPGHPRQPYEEDGQVRVWRLPRPEHRLGWASARLRLYRLCASWARADRLDVVEVPDWEGWAAGWRRLPVPVVARLHGSQTYFAEESGGRAPRRARALERASLRRADFVSSTSSYTANASRELFGLSGPIEVIPNLIDVTPGASAARGEREVVFSGTLTEKKGVIPLVRAWRLVARTVPSAELHIFGKDGRSPLGGPMRTHLISLLADRERASVRFHDHVPREEVAAALRRARLAVFPSYAEAFAMAPMEAMASGCPTVYTTRGSGPELIQDGINGLLIDPDRPDDIAEAIIALLTDDRMASDLGAAGRRRIEESFSRSALLDRTVGFYESCGRSFATATTARS